MHSSSISLMLSILSFLLSIFNDDPAILTGAFILQHKKNQGHSPGDPVVYSMVKSFFNLMSVEELPISTSNLPGSTTQSIFLLYNFKSSGEIVNFTVFFSPGNKP